jgi:hypothetical protein
MTRFDYRLKSLEKNFPVPDVSSFLEALSHGELEAVILGLHKFELAKVKDAGDKALAADLALIVKHDSAKLRRLPKQDRPSPKKTKQLINELMEAKDDDGAEFRQRGNIEDDFRQRVKEQAVDIRFAAEFSDLFERLDAGEDVEKLDENSMPLAMCRMRPEKESTWRVVKLISPYLPPTMYQMNLRHCNAVDNLLDRWRGYCRQAEQSRDDIRSGKKSVPSLTASAPKPAKPLASVPSASPAVKPAEQPTNVHELQRWLRNRGR